jgi:hypothetical protein
MAHIGHSPKLSLDTDARATQVSSQRSAPQWWTVVEDAMHNTRTAAEYRSAAIHLWELAAATTLATSHDAFANLAVIYETLADQGEAAENATALEPKDDWAR